MSGLSPYIGEYGVETVVVVQTQVRRVSAPKGGPSHCTEVQKVVVFLLCLFESFYLGEEKGAGGCF